MGEQNFDNHTKFVPLFQVYVLGVMALNFLWSLYHWKMTGFSLDGLVSVLLASGLVLLAFFARIFTLTVQDRVIRLEERLRYERVLPADLRPRISKFTLSQIVSMRFCQATRNCRPWRARCWMKSYATARPSNNLSKIGSPTICARRQAG
jgi:hypothetical protein